MWFPLNAYTVLTQIQAWSLAQHDVQMCVCWYRYSINIYSQGLVVAIFIYISIKLSSKTGCSHRSISCMHLYAQLYFIPLVWYSVVQSNISCKIPCFRYSFLMFYFTYFHHLYVILNPQNLITNGRETVFKNTPCKQRKSHML